MGPVVEETIQASLSVEDEPFQKVGRLKLDPALAMEEKDLEQFGAG